VVCNGCLLELNNELAMLRNGIAALEVKRPPMNGWDFLGLFLAMGILWLAFSGLMKNSEFWGFVFIGSLLSLFVSRAPSSVLKEKFHEGIRQRIKELQDKKEPLYAKLHEIYKMFWERPPDWFWRKEQVFKRAQEKCESCGRKMYGSRVPFHVHHRIPKSEPQGNHSLENLMLLCEICHAKVELPGHQLVKGARASRLKEEKLSGKKRRRRWVVHNKYRFRL